eukprot:scaffold109232_cov15-Tisochrysis_lutea.AAC.1
MLAGAGNARAAAEAVTAGPSKVAWGGAGSSSNNNAALRQAAQRRYVAATLSRVMFLRLFWSACSLMMGSLVRRLFLGLPEKLLAECFVVLSMPEMDACFLRSQTMTPPAMFRSGERVHHSCKQINECTAWGTCKTYWHPLLTVCKCCYVANAGTARCAC